LGNKGYGDGVNHNISYDQPRGRLQMMGIEARGRRREICPFPHLVRAKIMQIWANGVGFEQKGG